MATGLGFDTVADAHGGAAVQGTAAAVFLEEGGRADDKRGFAHDGAQGLPGRGGMRSATHPHQGKGKAGGNGEQSVVHGVPFGQQRMPGGAKEGRKARKWL